jgi:hypothetical protein
MRCCQAVVDQGLAQPHGGTQVQDPPRRDPRARQPALLQQLPQQPGVGAVGLGPPLGAAQAAGLGRLSQMREEPGRLELLDHEPPAGAPSTANAPSTRGSPLSQPRSVARVAGAIRPRWVSPLSRSTQSKVIWARCTSSPPMMLIGTSFELRPCGLQHDHPCLSRRGPCTCHLFLLSHGLVRTIDNPSHHSRPSRPRRGCRQLDQAAAGEAGRQMQPLTRANAKDHGSAPAQATCRAGPGRRSPPGAAKGPRAW